jgi:hypothetical protein
MKKIARFITSFVTIVSFALIPVTVHAQDSGVIDVNTDSTSSTTSTASTAGVPNTGVAPHQSKLGQNALIFIGGSLLGSVAGLAIVTARKKRFNQ